VTALWDGTARIWDVATSKEIMVLRNPIDDAGYSDSGLGTIANMHSAAFSPDGSRIVTASNDATGRIWDAVTGKEIAVLHGHDASLNSAAFSPDGSRIVTASDDNTARIWDAATGEEINVLRGHGAPVRSAAFSLDGSRIVTASQDKTARIWDARLQTMPVEDLLIEVCGCMTGLTELTREEMRLASYPDGMSKIDVCRRAESGAASATGGSARRDSDMHEVR
jgi:WD40 repeat protein